MKIALIGHGKMGKAVEAVIRRGQPHNHAVIARTFNRDNADTLTVEALKGIDVAVEFTTPLTAEKHIRTCIDAGVPVISGTTGWYDRLPELSAYCTQKNGAMLCAANFSIGVHLFLAVNAKLASLMQHQPQYAVSIEETHHTQKLDAPSGTAIRIAETIGAELPRMQGWVLTPDEKDGAIPITAHRIDHVPGIHTVHYDSSVDSITLTHTAHSRDGFAEGAWLAAQWIAGRKGLFTMQDVLSI